MCVAVLVGAVTLLAGGRVFAVTEMDISSLEQAAAQLENGRLRTKVVDGFIKSISLVAPADPTPRDPKSDEEMLHDFKAFLQTHWRAFRLDSPSDVGELEVARVLRVSPPDTEELTSSARSIPTEIVRLRQFVDHIPLMDQGVVVTFINGDIRFVDGFLVPASHVRNMFGGNLDQPTVSPSTAMEVVVARCAPVDVELHRMTGDVPTIDPVLGRFAYAFQCGDIVHLVDAVTADVYSSFSTVLPWVKHPSGATVKSVANGSTFSGHDDQQNAWLPNHEYEPSQSNFPGVLVDYINYGGYWCPFRYAYGGGTYSQPPFPSVSDGWGTLWVWGDCSDGYPGFDETSTPYFDYQTVYQRLNNAARHTIWQSNLKLWGWTDEVAPDYTEHYLYTYVYYSGNACLLDGDPVPGRFATGSPYNTICLDSGNYYYTPYYVPLHEYGHYIHHSYGLWDNPCQINKECAVMEGVADTLAISFEHFRYNPLVGSDANIDTLFRNGPGKGPCHDHDQCGWACPSLDGSGGFCRVEVTDGCTYPNEMYCAYQMGLAISQLMWKLLTNRMCISADCPGSVPSIQKIEPYSYYLTNAGVAAAGREAFTLAMAQMTSGFDTDDFLSRVLDNIQTRHWTCGQGCFGATGRSRVLAAFAHHGVD
ncbi:hypothetical protein ACFL6C_06750 [Myxococcota bacterium]